MYSFRMKPSIIFKFKMMNSSAFSSCCILEFPHSAIYHRPFVNALAGGVARGCLSLLLHPRKLIDTRTDPCTFRSETKKKWERRRNWHFEEMLPLIPSEKVKQMENGKSICSERGLSKACGRLTRIQSIASAGD